jgi:hypothetical protein
LTWHTIGRASLLEQPTTAAVNGVVADGGYLALAGGMAAAFDRAKLMPSLVRVGCRPVGPGCLIRHDWWVGSRRKR